MSKSASKKTWVRSFMISAVCVFIFSAVAKMSSLLSHSAVLDVPSPLIIAVSQRWVLAAACGVDVVAVVVLLSGRLNTLQSSMLILWICLLFTSYRIALWGSGFEGYCKCLGNTPVILGLSEGQAELLAKGMLTWLVGGACWVLWYEWELRRRQGE